MMSKTTQVALFLLLATFVAESTITWFPDSSTFFQSVFRLPRYFDFRTRDILSDRNFVEAKHIYNSSKLEPDGLWLELTGSETNNTIRKCRVPFKLSTLLQMRRLSAEDVLLPARVADGESGQEQIKLVLVNIDSCKYAYTHSVALSSEKLFFHPSGNPSDDSFTLIVYDKKLCLGPNHWCRLFFNPMYYKSEPLSFDFPARWLHDVIPVTSLDGYLFAAFILDDSITFRIRLYNLTNHPALPDYKELLSLPNFVNSIDRHYKNYRLHWSSLSHCWRTRQNGYEDSAAIHCAAFREDGTVLFNQTMVRPGGTQIWHVQSIPNGLILITSGCSSLEHDCYTVDVAVLTVKRLECIHANSSCPDSHSTSSSPQIQMIEIKSHQYHLECQVFDTMGFQSRVNLPNDSIELNYACIHGTYLHYSHLPLKEFETSYLA